MITLKECTILFPKTYVNKQLAYVGDDISLVGVFAICYGNKYGVSLVPSRFAIGDCLAEVIKIADEEYYRLTFSPGAVIFKSVRALKVKVFSYNIVNYFIDYGKVPWFFNYVDLAELLSDIQYWCNIYLGNQSIYDMLISIISRTHDDLRVYYRETIKSEADLYKSPRFIPVMEKSLTATSTIARITGGELKKAFRETLITDNHQREELEELFVK
ncbi:hypothetical protein [Clostridium sp.]|uniref:hypothetical protein n=1 Tax=Clostridium sp. TaxID=1506 RepID=UPI003F665CC0